jgi:hypothetical protein
MRAAAKAAVATNTADQSPSSTTGGVIDPGMFEVENPAAQALDLWTEMDQSFNPSYQLSRIYSQYMQFATDQEDMSELTEQLRLLVKGTKLAEC